MILIGTGGCSKQIWKIKIQKINTNNNNNNYKNLVFKTKNNFESKLLINSLAGKYHNYKIYDFENIKNGLDTHYTIASSFKIPDLQERNTVFVNIDFNCHENLTFLKKTLNYNLSKYTNTSTTRTTLKSSTRTGGKYNKTERNITVTNQQGIKLYKIDCFLIFNKEFSNENFSNKFSVEYTNVPEIHLQTQQYNPIVNPLLHLNTDHEFKQSPKEEFVIHPLNIIIDRASEFFVSNELIKSTKYVEFDTVFYDFDYKVHRLLINRSYDKALNRLIFLESNKEYQTHELYYLLGLTYHLKGNLKQAKTYYLKSIDLYEDQDINYPKLALSHIN